MILLPDDESWLSGKGVSLTLFEDLLAHPETPEWLRAELRFCVDAELDCLDLRKADDLSVLPQLVQDVLERRGQEPETPAVYRSELERLLQVLAQHPALR